MENDKCASVFAFEGGNIVKKILAVLLTAILILTGGLLAYALAEAPAVPAAGPTVDVTGLVIAVLLAAFEFLMARFALINIDNYWIPCHIVPEDTVAGISRVNASLLEVQFSVRLDINGSPFAALTV